MPKYEAQREHLARMIKRDKKLMDARAAYERMSRLEYRLPEPLASFEWAYPIVSTAPYDALRGGTRALANKQEGVRVNPISVLGALPNEAEDSKAARALANEWEINLKWQGQRIEKRIPAFRSSIVWSSLLYHEIVGLLIHLPTQFRASPIDWARKQAALRFGDWSLELVDPKTTYIDYSAFMPERVARVTLKTVQQLIDLWPDKTKKLQSKLEDHHLDQDTPYIEVDFTDSDERTVWCIEGNNIGEVIDSDKGISLFGPEPWLKVVDGEGKGKQVPFMPWIAVCGGLNIDALPEHQRKPMLYPVWAAEQWAASNVMGTILASLAVSEAAAPVNVIAGPGSDKVQVDYTQPGGRIDLPNQLLTYQRVQRAGLDKAMADMYAIMTEAIKRSTVAEILVTGSPMAGDQAYAAYNLQVMQALASLGDFKLLAERFIEEMYQKMLLIAHYTGHDIVGYGKNSDKYVIKSEDIDPGALYLSVELKPDVMVNELQKTAAAVQMAQNLPYAPQKLLEQLGEEDPEGSLRLWKRWRLALAHFNGILKKVEMTASGEIQQMAAQMAQEMLQQAAQAQPQTGAQGEPMSPGLGLTQEAGQNPAAPPGMALEGNMFGPTTGVPPAMTAPEATYEGQTGMSRGGQEAQGGY